MAQTSQGTAWPLYAIMKDGDLVGVVAKNPDRPEVIDIAEDLAALLHHRRSSPPVPLTIAEIDALLSQ